MSLKKRLIIFLTMILLAVYAYADDTMTESKAQNAAGYAIENSPSGFTGYGFFNQVLTNQFYYEIRLYTKYNYVTQNPIFPTVPVSDEDNPMGYGMAVKLGYLFHTSKLLYIQPYLRVNLYNNMSTVYQDTNGNFINSTTYAILPGAKFSFKVMQDFTPYVDYYGGYQKVNLVGTLNNSSAVFQNITGTISQFTTTMEVGFRAKISEHLSLTPYWQYVTTSNYPNDVAAASYNNGGFNINSFTSSINVWGFKLTANW